MPAESQAARSNLIAARVKAFPSSMEAIAVAGFLRREGFYKPSTRLVDIARRVSKLRAGPKKTIH